jgi:hypothetical protein
LIEGGVTFDVMPGHSRSQNGVALLAYEPGIPLGDAPCQPDRDHRDKPGDDRKKKAPQSFAPRDFLLMKPRTFSLLMESEAKF